MVDVKGLIPAILIIVTFAFAIAACAAPQIEKNNTKMYLVEYKVGSFKVQNEDYGCKKLRESANAAAAFGIMACIAVGVAVITSLATALAGFAPGKMITIVLLVVVVVFTIISWAVEIHIFRDDFCGSNLEKAGMELAGGFACMIITTGLALVSMILTFVLGGGDAK